MPTSSLNNASSLRILMLHGYTQSGPLFHSKTRALQKALTRAFPSHTVSFSFPTAPHRLLPTAASNPTSFALSNPEPALIPSGGDSQDENFGWWLRTSDDPIIYTGLEPTFTFLAGILRAEGPFDGVVGFSQGGALAGLLASALETNRVFPEAELGFPSPLEDSDTGQRWHPPLKFAVVYSGFRVMDARCRGFYDRGGIAETKLLHFIGGVDSVVDEGRSRALVDCCGSAGKKVVIHPGGHFLPSQRPWLDAVVVFVREAMEGEGDPNTRVSKGITEEKVEDMEVPF